MHEPEILDRDEERYARRLCGIGTDMLMGGHPDLALATLEESLRLFPTAEAYAFRGWTRATLGSYTGAISDCKRAIRLDPDYGKPYNDLGAYLIKMGFLEEAVVWLEKAKRVPHNEFRHFPYLNLGHVHLLMDEPARALSEYVIALELDPHNYVAETALSKMDLGDLVGTL